MLNFSKLKLSSRLFLMLIAVLAGLTFIASVSLYQLKASMLEERKEKIKNVTEIAVSVVTHHYNLFKAGQFSESEAKEAAKNALRIARYGAGKDYFYIYDREGINLMHPIRPEFEGTNKRDLKDSRGQFVNRGILEVAQNPNGGYVEFYFVKPGQEQQGDSLKLAYAKTFEPWGFVIGTGVYLDDVEQSFRKSAWLLGSIGLLAIALVAVLSWLVSRSILRQLGGEPESAARIMRQVADGDLSPRVTNATDDSLLGALGHMVTSLPSLVSNIHDSADSVVRNAQQINAASASVVSAAERQTLSTTAMASAIEQLTASSGHISDSAREAEKDSESTMSLASDGVVHVNQTSEVIQKISTTVSEASVRIHALDERARQVSSIANVIKDIAGQTNLLALNAAIEAARAGEQGRGFAVVADEVRKLAERTSLATTEIEQIIMGIQGDTVSAVESMNSALPEVAQGVQLTGGTADSLRTIENSTRRILSRIGEVAHATHEQSEASVAISQQVQQIATMVEETTGIIRSSSEASSQLKTIAENLKRQVEKFRLQESVSF